MQYNLSKFNHVFQSNFNKMVSRTELLGWGYRNREGVLDTKTGETDSSVPPIFCMMKNRLESIFWTTQNEEIFYLPWCKIEKFWLLWHHLQRRSRKWCRNFPNDSQDPYVHQVPLNCLTSLTKSRSTHLIIRRITRINQPIDAYGYYEPLVFP